MKMIKSLWSRFQQCLCTCTILVVDATSETRLLRHLSDYVFQVRNFESTQSMRVIFYSKILKFNRDLNNAAQNSEKFFCFWDNCIWICILKFSHLRRGYFSSAANVLTSSPKILHVNKRDFFQLNSLSSGQWTW